MPVTLICSVNRTLNPFKAKAQTIFENSVDAIFWKMYNICLMFTYVGVDYP